MPSEDPIPVDLVQYLANRTPIERELARLFYRQERLVIFDIGACEGEESIRYARCFPKARIFSFEPLPANQQLARLNFERYGVTSVELVPVALSNQSGTAEFHVSSGRPPHATPDHDWNYGNKSSSLLAPSESAPMFGWVHFEQTISVPTRTLDSFASERRLGRIDFIHMDVQGAEHLVLDGAQHTLPRVTAVWLEVSDRELYRGQRLRTDTERAMQASGFVKTLELRREIEGDQLYVNRRALRTWPYILARRLVDCIRRRQPRLPL